MHTVAIFTYVNNFDEFLLNSFITWKSFLFFAIYLAGAKVFQCLFVFFILLPIFKYFSLPYDVSKFLLLFSLIINSAVAIHLFFDAVLQVEKDKKNIKNLCYEYLQEICFKVKMQHLTSGKQ